MHRCLKLLLTPLVALAIAATSLVTASSASADWGGRNPAFSIIPTPAIFGSYCDIAPTSPTCRTRLVDALNNARHRTGHASYSLPDRFFSLSPQEKLLVLTNQDRVAEGLMWVSGLNAKLNANARYGISHRTDPSPVDYLGGAHWSMWAANWAGGTGAIESPMAAHYGWMYYDGLNLNGTRSWNLLCTVLNLGFCWGHRDNILAKPGSGHQFALGAAGGSDGQGQYGWTELFESIPSGAHVDYVPTVVRLNHHWAPSAGGRQIELGGFGFVNIRSVTVNGIPAAVVHHDTWHLTVRVPRGSPGSQGYIVVHTGGGTSSRNYAAQFEYGR